MGLIVGKNSETFIHLLLPFAAGGFIYIAAANLIPELQNENGLKSGLANFVMILLGIGIMVALLFLEIGA